MKKIVFILFLGLLMLCGCSKNEKESVDEKESVGGKDSKSIERDLIANIVLNYQNEYEALVGKSDCDNISIDEKCIIGTIKTDGEFYNLKVLEQEYSPKEFSQVISDYMANSCYSAQYNESEDYYLYDHETYTVEDEQYDESHMYLLNNLPEERISRKSEFDSSVVYLKNKCAFNFYGGGLGYYGNSTLYDFNPLEYAEDVNNYFQPFKFSDGKEKHYDCFEMSKEEVEKVLKEKNNMIAGEMSISEAYEVFLKNINKYYVNNDEKRNFNLSSVDLMRIKDKFFYILDIQLIYDNVPFLNDNMGSYRVSEFGTVIPFQCYIAERDDITAITALKGDDKIGMDEKIEYAYGLDAAIMLASKKLANNINFNVKSIDFGYAQFEEGGAYRLGWMLKGANTTRNEPMAVFVDAVNGKVYLNVGE